MTLHQPAVGTRVNYPDSLGFAVVRCETEVEAEELRQRRTWVIPKDGLARGPARGQRGTNGSRREPAVMAFSRGGGAEEVEAGGGDVPAQVATVTKLRAARAAADARS